MAILRRSHISQGRGRRYLARHARWVGERGSSASPRDDSGGLGRSFRGGKQATQACPQAASSSTRRQDLNQRAAAIVERATETPMFKGGAIEIAQAESVAVTGLRFAEEGPVTIRESCCGGGPSLHALQLRTAPCEPEQALPMTPAMAAGVADHVWTLEELVDLAQCQDDGGFRLTHYPGCSRPVGAAERG